jgi:hypothetical protein
MCRSATALPPMLVLPRPSVAGPGIRPWPAAHGLRRPFGGAMQVLYLLCRSGTGSRTSRLSTGLAFRWAVCTSASAT